MLFRYNKIVVVIKIIIMNAAFLAAEDSSSITMEHVIKAAKRKFQKIGRFVHNLSSGSIMR